MVPVCLISATPEETRRNKKIALEQITFVQGAASDVVRMASKAKENINDLDDMTSEEQLEYVSFWSKFREWFVKLWRAIKTILRKIWEGIKSGCRWVKEKVVGFCSDLAEFFKSVHELKILHRCLIRYSSSSEKIAL